MKYVDHISLIPSLKPMNKWLLLIDLTVIIMQSEYTTDLN